MTRSRQSILAFTSLFVISNVSHAGTVSANVADYNAAQVRLSNGVLVVPAAVATYTSTGTLAIGSTFVVTLPSGLLFGSLPSLTTSGTATFTLTGGGVGMPSATFTIATAAVTATQTISLAGFSVTNAIALETVTPVASALSLTMQAVGSDLSPLSVRAFGSDVGLQAIFVGAIQFIDINPPSNATKFFSSPDTLTAVISAMALQAQTTDAASSSVPVLGSNGLLNTLHVGDTGTVTIFGNFGGVARVFSSTTSDCSSPISYGTTNGNSASIPNVALGTEIFFCVTGSGGVLQANLTGFTTVTAGPGSSTDFLTANAIVEFPGEICYAAGNSTCVAFTPPAPISTPTLSAWSMIGLTSIMLLIGVWKLNGATT